MVPQACVTVPFSAELVTVLQQVIGEHLGTFLRAVAEVGGYPPSS